MSFQRLSEGVEGKSRPPESRWKVVPQSRTGGRETPITEFVTCSWHKQLPHVIGVGPQWATTNVRQKATVVCEVRGSRSNKRLMYEPGDLGKAGKGAMNKNPQTASRLSITVDKV